MASIKDFAIGQEVVAFSSKGVPCQCNSEFSPAHPCRVTITKVGKTKVHGMMSGKSNPVAMAISFDDHRGLVARPVEDAKREYRDAMAARGTDPEWVNVCVNKL